MAAVEEEPSSSLIANFLSSNPVECDLLWGVFVAAVHNYRHDTLVRPFPPMYKSKDESSDHDDGKRFDALKTDVKTINQLSSLCAIVSLEEESKKKCCRLINFILGSKSFHITHTNPDEFQKIKRKTGQIIPTPEPNFVFQVNYCESRNSQWEEVKGSRDVIYAYHGTRLENVYSILNCGLQSHMNKVSLYGEGTYLSSELCVSLNWSPGGLAWPNCRLGDGHLSVVLVCELIDHPAVRAHRKGGENSAGQRLADNIGGAVPEKYFVVSNNDLLRVRYLLVYGSGKPSAASCQSASLPACPVTVEKGPEETPGLRQRGNVTKPVPVAAKDGCFERAVDDRRRLWRHSWVFRHRFLLLIASYGAVLVAVGLLNNRSFLVWWRRTLSPLLSGLCILSLPDQTMAL